MISSFCGGALLRLITSSAAAACSQQGHLLSQQIVAGAAAVSISRQFSDLAASISIAWNANPHQLPATPLPDLRVPDHAIEEGLPEVTAWLRTQTGTNFCTKLRRAGSTPCMLFSLPGNQAVSLALDNKDAARLVNQFGRNGLQAQALRLNIFQQQPAHPAGSSSSSSSEQQQQQLPEQQQQQTSSSSSSSSSSTQLLASVRVLPKEVHMNSVTQVVENFRFMFCPQDRRVKVNVPVKLWNGDVSPGVKAGGWLHVVNRTIPVLAYGWAIKPFVELDMKHMRNKDVMRYRDVALPEGCVLHVKDPMQPIVRCAVRVGGD